MLQDETTYKESFKQSDFSSSKCKPVVIPELKFLQPPTNDSIDIVSLSPYQVNRGVEIPFDLFWTPKPIVGQTPNYNTIFKHNPPVESRVKVKMTTVLSPCTQLEEAEDDKIYKRIIDNMYLSTKSKADKDIEKLCQRRKAPDMCVYTANPITLNTGIYEKLPKEYIEVGKHWDSKNSRWLSDQNKYYWNKYYNEQQNQLSHRNHEKNLIIPEKKQELHELIIKNEIRSPHTTYIRGYSGYKPIAALGVPIKKNDFPVDHPLTSLTSAVYKCKRL